MGGVLFATNKCRRECWTFSLLLYTTAIVLADA